MGQDTRPDNTLLVVGGDRWPVQHARVRCCHAIRRPGRRAHVAIETAGRNVYSSKSPEDTGSLSAALGHRLEFVRHPRIVESRVRAGRTLHILTNASIEQMKRTYPAGDFDPRRFRPNILMTVDEGLTGYVEEDG